jgi:hypothetical protein
MPRSTVRFHLLLSGDDHLLRHRWRRSDVNVISIHITETITAEVSNFESAKFRLDFANVSVLPKFVSNTVKPLTKFNRNTVKAQTKFNLIPLFHLLV